MNNTFNTLVKNLIVKQANVAKAKRLGELMSISAKKELALHAFGCGTVDARCSILMSQQAEFQGSEAFSFMLEMEYDRDMLVCLYAEQLVKDGFETRPQLTPRIKSAATLAKRYFEQFPNGGGELSMADQEHDLLDNVRDIFADRFDHMVANFGTENELMSGPALELHA